MYNYPEESIIIVVITKNLITFITAEKTRSYTRKDIFIVFRKTQPKISLGKNKNFFMDFATIFID